MDCEGVSETSNIARHTTNEKLSAVLEFQIRDLVRIRTRKPDTENGSGPTVAYILEL
jgi:hypothetical protein